MAYSRADRTPPRARVPRTSYGSGQPQQTRPEKKKRSAGRNLPVAIAVGILLGALTIACLVIPGAWYPLVSVASLLATWEVTKRLSEADYVIPRWLMIIGGQAVVWGGLIYGVAGMIGMFILVNGIIMIRRLFIHAEGEGPKNYVRDTAVSLFVMFWINLTAACGAMLSWYTDGHIEGWKVIVTFMLCVVANDVGGYAAGVLFGAHPMAPHVSPKKSWEGFAGSVGAGMVMGTLCTWLLLGQDPLFGLLVGFCIVCAATMGDLMESQFKRELGIKDMSKMIPGHGGLMDRLDGMLPAAAMTWVLITLLRFVN